MGPQEVQNPWFLIQLTLTHYTSRSVFFRAHPTPPICLKMPKCAIFSPSLAFHFKHHPNVGVYRENFLIGKLAQNLFMVFYICWHYAISFSTKFPIRKFSLSPSQSPLSGLFLQRGDILGNNFKKISKRQTKNPGKIYVTVIGIGVWISLKKIIFLFFLY